MLVEEDICRFWILMKGSIRFERKERIMRAIGAPERITSVSDQE